MEFIYGDLFLSFYVILDSLWCLVCSRNSENTSWMNQYSILISEASCTGAKGTVSSYRWSHRGEIAHSGSDDVREAQDGHSKESSEIFRGFLSINILYLILYLVIAICEIRDPKHSNHSPPHPTILGTGIDVRGSYMRHYFLEGLEKRCWEGGVLSLLGAQIGDP